MPIDQQICAIWRITISRHRGGRSITYRGSTHTYEAHISIRAGEYLEGDTMPVPAQWATLNLTRRERNNW